MLWEPQSADGVNGCTEILTTDWPEDQLMTDFNGNQKVNLIQKYMNTFPVNICITLNKGNDVMLFNLPITANGK